MTEPHQLQLDRLNINGDNNSGLPPGLAVGGRDMRKQRSQRFTIPTSNSPSSPANYQSPPPLPPPSSQTADAYYSFNRKPPAQTVDNQGWYDSASSNDFASAGYGGSAGGSAGYSTGKSATSGSGRLGLPTEWLGGGAGSSNTVGGGREQGRYDSRYDTLGPPGGVGGGGGGVLGQAQHQGYAALLGKQGPGGSGEGDDIIPTAIVIKNIPFHVSKEYLLGVMEDLLLPPPFAFNYHYDNSQFRGLAFANFRSPSDASMCVSALNGFDLQGRKLRTEFKKVLKEGEKERIERDKAIKRMRSQQLVPGSSSSLLPSDPMGPPHLGPPIGSWNRREASAPGGMAFGSAPGEEEDYGRVLVGGVFSTAGGSGGAGSSRDIRSSPYEGMGIGVGMGIGRSGGGDRFDSPVTGGTGFYGTSPPSDVGTSVSARMTNTGSSGSAASEVAKPDLDMNDPQTLEIYSRVLLFKDDSFRDELAFARSLTPIQRRTVHLVARKLGLDHGSVGEGEDRHVVVFKAGVRPQALPAASKVIRHSTSTTLGRQPSRNDLSSPNSFLQYPHDPSAYLYANPNNSNPNLRSKKSLPDIRGPAYINPNYNNNSSSPRRSTANLRENYQYQPPHSVHHSPQQYHQSQMMSTRKSTSNLNHNYNPPQQQQQQQQQQLPPQPPMPTSSAYYPPQQPTSTTSSPTSSSAAIEETSSSVGGGAAGSVTSTTSGGSVAVRQPKGPLEDAGFNFANRSGATEPEPIDVTTVESFEV